MWSWRFSFDDALKPVDSPVSSNGPYAIRQGAMAAVCVHEASHAVAVISMGKRLDQIEVALNFERWDDGVYAAPGGRCKLKGVTRDAIDVRPADVPLSRSREPTNFCWLGFIKNAIVTCAGPAGEMKYRAQDGLPRGFIGASDSLEWYSRIVWATAGRDGAAFARLAWREACRLMDVPVIWKAVQAVEAELFSGLLRLEPADPRPGDRVQFVMPGSRAEELIEAAGIALPNILAPHQCDSTCIRGSRKVSRRWQDYLAAWATEGASAAA
jgi:hypothetical protein